MCEYAGPHARGAISMLCVPVGLLSDVQAYTFDRSSLTFEFPFQFLDTVHMLYFGVFRDVLLYSRMYVVVDHVA